MSNSYRELPPSRRLAEYVECYWMRDSSPFPADQCVLPDGCVDILFSRELGDRHSLSVVGLMTTARRYEVAAGSSFFGVRFHPGMAAVFVREAGQMNDCVEPLESVWGSRARTISERLAEAARPEEMVRIVEGVLDPAPADYMQRALRELPNWTDSLSRLALETGMSERNFRRTCTDRTGVPPQYLRRILRFRRAADRIQPLRENVTAQPSWAQFAAACGYYDQAHLIREFREFAGCTPGRFVQSSGGSDGLESMHYEPKQSDRLR